METNDDKRILKHGESITIPVTLMDADQRHAHQAAYEQRLANAWRDGSQQPAKDKIVSSNDSQAQYEQRLRDGWKTGESR